CILSLLLIYGFISNAVIVFAPRTLNFGYNFDGISKDQDFYALFFRIRNKWQPTLKKLCNAQL
ncbi:unnamed protein product, partial [Hymenolepis diminuta]